MKTREPHLVPLSVQAIAILRELHPLTGSGRYVFPSLRTAARPMSETTMNAALRRMGYAKDEMTGHGFRAMARTILDEVLGVRPDFIEHQLAHTVRDPLGRAYNRTTHLPERRRDDAGVGGLPGRTEKRRRGGAAAWPGPLDSGTIKTAACPIYNRA